MTTDNWYGVVGDDGLSSPVFTCHRIQIAQVTSANMTISIVTSGVQLFDE